MRSISERARLERFSIDREILQKREAPFIPEIGDSYKVCTTNDNAIEKDRKSTFRLHEVHWSYITFGLRKLEKRFDKLEQLAPWTACVH